MIMMNGMAYKLLSIIKNELSNPNKKGGYFHDFLAEYKDTSVKTTKA